MAATATRHTTGAQRARALLFNKLRANETLYAGLPQLGSAALNMATETRQTLRAFGRANDYWEAPQRSGISHAVAARNCRREHATDRERTSCRVIAANRPRQRLSTKPFPRFALGSKHAWQRKAAFWAAMRGAIAKRDAA